MHRQHTRQQNHSSFPSVHAHIFYSPFPLSIPVLFPVHSSHFWIVVGFCASFFVFLSLTVCNDSIFHIFIFGVLGSLIWFNITVERFLRAALGFKVQGNIFQVFAVILGTSHSFSALKLRCVLWFVIGVLCLPVTFGKNQNQRFQKQRNP